MIKIMEMLDGFRATLSKAEIAAAGKSEYSDVRQALDLLSAAVSAAKADDAADAGSFWTDIKSKVVNFLHYDSEKARFDQEVDALIQQVDAALVRVKAQCKMQIGIHEAVPNDLMGDRDAWQHNCLVVKSAITKISKFSPMENWRDNARVGYDTIVGVQVKALTELDGIMASTAQSCLAGAQLNRAIFFVVEKAIRKATGAIQGAKGSGFLTYYCRTSTAIQVLFDLLREIEDAKDGGVASGSLNALSREHRNTIQMPNLLRVGLWPTGSEGAAYNPANTAEGVQGDGSNADLRVDGNTGSEGQGVKL